MTASSSSDALDALRKWMEEIRRLFAGRHSMGEIAAAAQVRYEVIVEIGRPRS